MAADSSLTNNLPAIIPDGVTCLNGGESLRFHFLMNSASSNLLQSFSAENYEQFQKEAKRINPNQGEAPDLRLKVIWAMNRVQFEPRIGADGKYICKPGALTN